MPPMIHSFSGWLNRLGLKPWLAPVWSSATLGYRKPRREAFMAIAQRWSLLPNEMVGGR